MRDIFPIEYNYLVDIVLLDASFRHNNTFCQLLQFQVMKQRELEVIIFTYVSIIYSLPEYAEASHASS